MILVLRARDGKTPGARLHSAARISAARSAPGMKSPRERIRCMESGYTP
jgi:hypothetical protein